MAGYKVLGADDSVGFDKAERYKGQRRMTDYIRPFRVELRHPIDGTVTAGVFFEHSFYTGRRPDGSTWFCAAHPDPAQNVAQTEQGQKLQTSACAVVLHMMRADPRAQTPMTIMRFLVWSAGADKWRRLSEFERQHGPLDAHEIIVQCEDTEEGEKFQRLNLSLVNPAEQLLPQFIAAEPTLMSRLAESFKAAYEDLQNMLRPMNAAEQRATIAGRNATPPVAPGFAPAWGGAAAPVGQPAAGRPSFMGAPALTFAGGAAPAQPAIPAAPALPSSSIPAGLMPTPSFPGGAAPTAPAQPAAPTAPTAPTAPAQPAAPAPAPTDPTSASFQHLLRQMGAAPPGS